MVVHLFWYTTIVLSDTVKNAAEQFVSFSITATVAVSVNAVFLLLLQCAVSWGSREHM